MPEEINRAVEDLFSFGAPHAPAHQEEWCCGSGLSWTASEPLSPWLLEFLQLEAGARAWALMYSGGGRGGDAHSGSSGLTLREKVERQEIRWMRGANVLAGTASERIMDGARKMLGAEE